MKSYAYDTNGKFYLSYTGATLLMMSARQAAAGSKDRGKHIVVKCQDVCCACTLLTLSTGDI